MNPLKLPQVVNEGDWTNRSLVYLCRSFGKLTKGGNYSKVKSATHIGIVDFSLEGYGLSPEFYAKYRLMNVKNHERYVKEHIEELEQANSELAQKIMELERKLQELEENK